MSSTDIIDMAMAAGFERIVASGEDWVCFTDEIKALVEMARAQEREACAKVCEDKAKRYDERAAQNAEVRDIDPTVAAHAAQACEHAAAAIRARGQA